MIFKELTRQDFRVASTVSNQLVDVLQDDTSTPEKRKRYQNWYSATKATATELPSVPIVLEALGDLRQVVSGLFQTVHDIDHSQQTANPLLDMTFGIRGGFTVDEDDNVVWNVQELNDYFDAFDAQRKAVWEQRSLMVNEKIDVYGQMASQLLGSREAVFRNLLSGDAADDIIDYALFLNFRRLFFRDGVKRGTFAMRLYRDLLRPLSSTEDPEVFSIQSSFPYWVSAYAGLGDISENEIIITDTEVASDNASSFGGQVGVLRVVSYNNSDPLGPYSPFEDVGREVGLIFYDAGIVVLNAAKLFNVEQKIAGIISSLVDNGLDSGYDDPGFFTPPGLDPADVEVADIVNTATTGFLPLGKRLAGLGILAEEPSEYTLLNLFIEGSIDDVLDHVASTRFISDPESNLSALTFQNVTKIKSMLVFCRVAPGEFNYSNNPTYVDVDGQIIARDDAGVKPFSYITKVGLYSANNDLLAVASLSRPIENGPDRDLTLRLRLDF
jgi:hypothetical protein